MLTCGRCVRGASHGVMITHTAVSCLVEVPRYTTRQERPLTQTLTLQDDTRRMHGSCRRHHACNSTDTHSVCSALRRTQGFPSPPERAGPWKPQTAAARPGARRAEAQQRQAAPPALELRKRFALPGTGGTACVLRHVREPSSVVRGLEGVCMVFFGRPCIFREMQTSHIPHSYPHLPCASRRRNAQT